jgi:two-component system LytT family response regulator
MPGISGFEVLSSLKRPWPQVIFTTAHDQFAIKAFDINAVDYLLKPFSDERFEEAVRRAKRKIEESKESTIVRDLGQSGSTHLKEGSSFAPESLHQKNRLVIKSDGSIHLIDFFSVRYIEAFDYYIKIHVESRFYLLRESMKAISEKLPQESFVRIHKSFIVNMAWVKTLHKLDNSEYEVELKGGEKLKVSRNFKTGLLEKLNS